MLFGEDKKISCKVVVWSCIRMPSTAAAAAAAAAASALAALVEITETLSRR